jgi:hypothetical protein
MHRLLLAAALLVACQDSDADNGIDRSRFVATYVDLRRATNARALDDATRDSILEAHGTTEAELRAYVELRANDPEAIADTWREIMDSIAAGDSIVAQKDTLRAGP